jgi:hypothetical protein
MKSTQVRKTKHAGKIENRGITYTTKEPQCSRFGPPTTLHLLMTMEPCTNVPHLSRHRHQHTRLLSLRRNAIGRTIDLGVAVGRNTSRLLVRLDVEVDEEEEVASKESTAEESGTLGAGTGALGREIVRLPGWLGGKVRVGWSLLSIAHT